MDSKAEIAYWCIRQLMEGHVDANDFFCIRVIHNERPFLDPQTGGMVEPTKCVFQRNIPFQELVTSFFAAGGLFERLQAFNADLEKPANIYFGVNARTDPKRNTKDSVKSFGCFYLDMDVNSEFTYQDRLAQISFWKACGFDPSIAVHSGHGIQPYWCLSRSVTREEGERALKRIVRLAGCTEGGNTWDITRILRLPGFDNVKYWYRSDTPPCHIIYPEPGVASHGF